jgi:hypothetical protein
MNKLTIEEIIGLPRLIFTSLTRGIERKDFLVFLFIVLLLTFVFILPDGLKQLLILNRDNFAINQLWTTSWTHQDFGHYLGNFCGFVVSFWLALAMFNELKKKKTEFYVPFATILVIVPLMTSLAFLYYLSFNQALGFSDVVSAMLGLCLYFAIEYFNQGVSRKIQQHGVPLQLGLAFFLGLTILSLFIDQQIVTAIMLTIIVIYLIVKYQLTLKKARNFIINGRKRFMLIGITIFIIICFPSMTSLQVQNGSYVNGLAHFLGLYLGLFLPNILNQIQTSIQKYKQEKANSTQQNKN